MPVSLFGADFAMHPGISERITNSHLVPQLVRLVEKQGNQRRKLHLHLEKSHHKNTNARKHVTEAATVATVAKATVIRT